MKYVKVSEFLTICKEEVEGGRNCNAVFSSAIRFVEHYLKIHVPEKARILYSTYPKIEQS